jgi:hypothetical protein
MNSATYIETFPSSRGKIVNIHHRGEWMATALPDRRGAIKRLGYALDNIIEYN